MDRSWMNAIRISDVYENGVEEFLKFAEQHGTALNRKYFCPCNNYIIYNCAWLSVYFYY